MAHEQQESAGLYAQCLALWLAGGIVFVTMRSLAERVLPVAGGREFGFRTALLYVGVLLLLGVAVNVALFVTARFSPLVRGLVFRAFNASVFFATVLTISLFFVMSHLFYTTGANMRNPQVAYPFVALVIVLTATIFLVGWAYYRAEFAGAQTTGRFWFSFLTLAACMFFSLSLLVFFNRGSRLEHFDPYAFSMNVILGLGWVVVHALAVRLVGVPLFETRGTAAQTGDS